MDRYELLGLSASTSAAWQRVGARRRSAARALPALRYSERKMLLAIVDLLVINLALYGALFLHPRLSGPAADEPHQLSWYLVLSGLWLVVGSALDVYDLARAADAPRSVWASAGAAAVACGLYLVLPVVTPGLASRRFYALLLPTMATVGMTLWRVAYAKAFTQPVFSHSVLVIGAGQAASELAQTLRESGSAGSNGHLAVGHHILGFVDDDPAKQGVTIEGARVLGTGSDLLRLVQTLRPDELIVSISNLGSIREDLFQAILRCWEAGIPVTTMSDLYERLTARVPVEHAGRMLHIVVPLSHPASYRLYLLVRRVVEVIVALVGSLIVLSLVPIVWLANRLTSPGDVFYRQERVGEGGRVFRVVKFRSMVMNAEGKSGAVWARRNDDRITPVGRILRKARLDEWPQFWNVVKGDMSLIGPRPERPEFVDQLAQLIPFYRMRHAVRPGITGWAQVKYGYGTSVQDSLVKLQYDLYYIKHQGLYMDLLILLRSFQVVLGMKGQ
jgi:exopolysaccharide biosynthesis polyprenyl glycosylphosphotransferase